MRLLLLLFLLFSLVSAIERPWEDSGWINDHPSIYMGIFWYNFGNFNDSLETISIIELESSSDVYAKIFDAKKHVKKASENLEECYAKLSAEDIVLYSLVPSYSTFKAVQKIDACSSYVGNWKNAIDSFLSAVELTSSKLDAVYFDYAESRELLDYSGVCAQDSPFRKDVICDFTYDYDRYLYFVDEGIKELKNPYPDLSPFGSALSYVWEGDFISKLKQMHRENIKLYNNSYSSTLVRISSLQNQIDEKESYLKQYSWMTDLSYAYSTSFSDSLTVAKRYENFYYLISESRTLISSANLLIENKPQNYLNNASKLLDRVEFIVSSFDDFDNLVYDAEYVVENRREELISLLQKTDLSPQGVEYISVARSYLEKGDSADNLGDAFRLYEKGIYYANLADSIDVSSASLLFDLESLIQKAEQDGLDVTYEKNLLAFLKSGDVDISEYYVDIEQSILAKAEKRYGYLNDLRDELYSFIEAGGVYTEDLKYELDMLGELSIADSMGSLKDIESRYLSIQKELFKQKKDILSNVLASSAEVFIPYILLDEPSTAYLDLYVSNPTAFSSSEVTVVYALSQPLDISLSDVVSGYDRISSIYVDGNSLFVTYKYISAYDDFSVSIEKDMVFARTLDFDQYIVGLFDGTASIEEQRSILLEVDGRITNLPEDTVVNDRKVGYLSKGEYLLQRNYIEEGYSVSKRDVSVKNIGYSYYVDYVLDVTPYFDFDELYLFIEVPPEAENAQITSLTLKLSSTTKTATGYEVILSSLTSNTTIPITVSYTVINNTDYLESQIEFYDNRTNSTYLPMLKEAFLQGDLSDAIKYLELVKSDYEKEKRRVEKNKKSLDKLWKKLDQELALLDSLTLRGDHEFIQKLSLRKNELKEIKDSNDVSSLKQIDFKWLKKEVATLTKNLYKNYSKLGYKDTLFDLALKKLQTTGKVEDAVSAVYAFEDVLKKAQVFNESKKASKEEDLKVLKDFKRSFSSLWNHYLSEKKDAEGTRLSSYFDYSKEDFEDLYDESESVVGTKKFDVLYEKMLSFKEDVQNTIDVLESESASLYAVVSEDVRTKSQKNKLSKMYEFYNRGEYVKAILTGELLMKSKSEKPDFVPLSIFTALVILSIAGYLYFYKYKKKPVVLKKIKKIED